ncbi:MAG: nucleoside deaminase [Paludibacteraceae bacterium]|nr:nucleoside deaminase [Paludibacteraceae bacterium]
MDAAYRSGADIVVVGNHFEDHPEDLSLFCRKAETLHSDDERYMRLALAEAEKALAADEIPIGCVIVSQNQIIGRGHNLTETLDDVTAHAEMQAITAAAQTVGGKYLPDATLYVTVEPCIMCAGAIGWAQIKRIVYGASDPKRGFATFAPRAFHPKANITSGVLESECRSLIQEFFKKKRS